MKSLSLGLLMTLATASVAFADGDTVYENGNTDFSGGNEMTQWLQAEDFMLDAATSINGAEIDMLDFAQFPLESGIDWWILADNGGQPGGIIASGRSDAVLTDLGANYWNLEWKFDAVALAANTPYYFAVHNDDDYADRENRYWANTLANGTNTGWESDQGTMDNWFNNGAEHAFSLQAIPEPTTIGLLALGAFGVVRRRR